MNKTLQRHAFKRRALIERLERRDLLAANPFGTNPLQRFDVSRDGAVSPIDALRVLNAIGRSDGVTADPARNIGNFIDVNGDGVGTPLDALHVLNVLALNIPVVAATLPNDSAPGAATNLDLISNDYRIDLRISSGKLGNKSVFARIDGAGNDPFVDITGEFTESVASLTTQTIDAIAGSPLADGDHQFEVRIGTEGDQIQFELTVDRAAPAPQLLVDPTVRRSFDSAQLDLGETVATTLVPTSFELAIDGGAQHGETVPIRSVDTVNESTRLLSLFQSLPDQAYRLRTTTAVEDLAGNVLGTGTEIANFLVADPPGIRSTSPTAGEELVSVIRKTIVRFDEPVDASTVTTDAFYLIANGERVDGSIRVSSTERFATFFYDAPLPASTEIRVVVDGAKIIGRDGLALDADGDDEPGGVQNADFRTLPLTPVKGTGVFGFVKDSNTGEPIVGATIRVDSLPGKNVVTDVNGRFELTDMPAPEFFVHIDGTTATNLPAGYLYPNVGKPFHSKAGRLVQLNMGGTPFDIYLPPLKETDIQGLSPTEPTLVGFGTDGRSRLEQILPDIDPTLFDEFSLTVEPGAALDDLGTPATTAAIIPVEPDRIPAPLPSYLDPQLVVSIQVPGATGFDVPAEVTFPNFDGLAPGEKSSIFSFDHDAGKWKIVGTGTVSEDGRRIVSDGGVIEAPGWHTAQTGSLAKGGYKDFGQGQASVTISGVNRIFTAENQEAQIVISNTSNKPVKAEVRLDKISQLTKTSIDNMTLDLGPKESKTIDFKARKVTEDEIKKLQDDDPNTNHAKIYTGTVKVTATSGGAPLADETFLYALIVAKDAKLAFPNVLKEADSQPAADEKKVLHLSVAGPIQDMSFAGDDQDITFVGSQGSATFSVLSTELLDRLQSPSGELTLSHKGEALPAIPINAADAIQLDPFAIRRVSGKVTGDINQRFTIEGKVEIGLAGPTFEPLFAINGTFEVNEEFFLLSGSITTNLLEDIPGFGPEVFLTEKDKKVLRINRMTKKFELFPSQDVPDQPPKENAFVLAGLKFTVTDMFLPETGVGLGLRGKITLPDKLGNVEIDIGSGENSDNSVIITTAGVDLTGATVAFPDQKFTIFKVQAEATDLSLEFQKRGVDDLGVERGNRFLLRGQLELLFPKFDPELRIAASFASPEDEEALVDLSESLGKAWTFALEEEPDLATIDAKADSAPEPEDPPDDSFIRLEFKPDGTLGLDAVGRIALESWKLGKLATVEDVFLQIDTVNDNYLGFARVLTPFKKAGEINALVGFEGGELDLVAVGVGELNGGVGFQMGTTPMYLQAIGSGVKDLTDGVRGIDFIASLTSTLGPATNKLFKGFALPGFLGGATFEPGNLLQIDVGGSASLEGFRVGGQVVVGGDEEGGLLVGTGKVVANFVDPSVVIQAKLEALGGLLRLEGLDGGEFASLAVNSNFDVAGQGKAIAQLPDSLPFPLGFAEGKVLGSASGVVQFTNDGISENDFVAFWGEIPLFTNPFNGNPVTAVAGVQVFLAAKFPNLITSLGEAAEIAGASGVASGIASQGEGEFTGQKTFTIEADTPFTLFATQWDTVSTTAEIELVDPTGTVIVESDFDSRQEIIVIGSSETDRNVVVVEPMVGNWTVRLVDPENDDLGETQFTSFLSVEPATLELTNVDLSGNESSLTIDFVATETTEDATVSLFLDTDQNDFDGALLAADVAVAFDGTGSTVIDLSNLDLPAGEYFVFGVLDEPGKPLVTSDYVDAGFQITDNGALAVVDNVVAAWVGENQLKVQWDAVDGAEAYRIGLTDNAAGADLQQSLVVGANETSVVLSDTLLITPLIVGETYRLEVVAIDVFGSAGQRGGQAIGIVGPSPTVPPETGQFDVFADPGSTFTGQLSLGQDEIASMLVGPSNATVDSDGSFTWDVPTDAQGFTDLRFKITPAIGPARFENLVLAAQSPPAGIITGLVFDDTNRDGVQDSGESGASGIAVELVDVLTGDVLSTTTSADVDLNDDQTIDPESEQGVFSFTDLAAGEFSVRRVDVANQPQRVTLAANQTETLSLGHRSQGRIAGAVLDDNDFDGQGDVSVSSVVVYMDLDESGSLTLGDRETVTDENGGFLFDDLLAGEFDIGIVAPDDFDVVGPTVRTVVLAIDEALDDHDIALQLTPSSSLSTATLRVSDADDAVGVFNLLEFGEILVDGTGGDRLTRNLELLNLGGENLVIHSARLADVGSGFVIDGLDDDTTIIPDGILGVTSAHPFSLSFDPTQSGVVETQLVITSNDPSSPTTVRLTGNARSPDPELSVILENNNAGGITLAQSETRAEFVTLRNTGNQPLSITSITGSLGFQPVDLPAGFPDTPIALAVDESIDIDVSVRATQLGIQGGTLTFMSNDPANPVIRRGVIATGIPASGPQASVGEDFVAIKMPALSAAPVLRGTTNLIGSYEFFLTAQAAYEVTLFDPVTGLVAKSLGQTAATGVVTNVTQPSFVASLSPDSDGDLLPDDAEFAVGTSATNPDTDGDGVFDYAELRQGLDPLSGLSVSIGTLASLPLMGQANEIELVGSTDDTSVQNAYVATGSHGLAIIDASDAMNPITLGQLDLPGDATDVAVAASANLAAIATGTGGLQLVDVSDPMLPTLIRSVDIEADRLDVFGSIAFVANSTSLVSVDMESGTILQQLDLGELTDVVRLGPMLYTMGSDKTLSVIEVTGLTMSPRGSVILPNGAGRLFVWDGVVIATAESNDRGGIVTVDISDPDVPTLISDSDVLDPSVGASTAIAANGTGLALIVGNPVDTPVLDVVDVTDLENTATTAETFRARVSLPSAPSDVVIAAGIGYVANGIDGLQVVNFLAFDDQGVPPTVSIDASSADVDALSAGIQVFEGRSLPIELSVSDDVQLRSVELLVDGIVVRNDVSFPFDVTALVPNLTGGATSESLMLQVRGTDTGGNASLSQLLELEVIKDDVAPTISSISLNNNDEFPLGFMSVEVDFSERIASIDTTNVFVTGPSSDLVEPVNLLVAPDGTSARLTYQLLEIGDYQLTIDAANVRDVPGNPLGGSPILTDFSVPAVPATNEPLFPGFTLPLIDGALATATGDFNGDLIPDLAVAVEPGPGGPFHTLDIYLGIGNGTFADPIRDPLTGIPDQLFVGDFTGDQIDDVLIRYKFQINISVNREILAILFGQGDGTFGDDEILFGGKSIETGSYPNHLAVGDFDGDSDLDVFATTSNGSIKTFLNRGAGTFTTVLNPGFGFTALDSAVGDVTGDGSNDVVAVRNDVATIFSNDGSGTFSAIATPDPSGTRTSAVALADLNDDQNLDLIFGDRIDHSVSVMLGNGDGTFADELVESISIEADAIVVGDINKDSNLDLLVGDFGGVQLTVLLGDGAGDFSSTNLFSTSKTTAFIKPLLTDFDFDQNLDVVIPTQVDVFKHQVEMVYGLGDGTFLQPVRAEVSDGTNLGTTETLTTGDLNGDGILDLISTNLPLDQVIVNLGVADGTFGAPTMFGGLQNPFAPRVGLFDNDAHLDVAISNGSGIVLMLGDGTGSLGTPIEVYSQFQGTPRSFEVVDLDQDNELDLIAVVSGTVTILMGNGDGSFEDPILITAPVRALGSADADVNGDGLLDVVIGSDLVAGTPAVSLQQADGSFGAFQDLVPSEHSGASPNAVVTADLNGDNRIDVVSSNQDSDDVTIMLQNSSGDFFVAATLTVGDSPRDVLAEDLNDDGNIDLVISNRFDGHLSVYLGDGDGTFADELRFSVGGNPMEMALADFNQDGLLDLAVIDTLAKDIVVLLNRTS
ncbi:hypothetical protein CKO51_18350 [Rhodopirellula sp. SM50]|nr:FG-GAP-like repeat-containing protein [Rhodopirellula sp. SM50]PAY17972.1 hypothetical protein CKO51_18350 [Rhodopirellula sp. SM50]